jgi:IS4 transposase
MDKSDFASLPESIQIRALAFRIVQRGFRTREITLATTLLDEDTYPAEDLAALYRTRWQAEINLRHLKTTMGLEVLKCKTVQGVLKELWIYVLVYNLVCMVMLEAARRQNVAARRISFNDALRWLAHAP